MVETLGFHEYLIKYCMVVEYIVPTYSCYGHENII